MKKFPESFKSMEFVNLINHAPIIKKKPSVFEWLRNKLKQENEPAFEEKVKIKICEDKNTEKVELKLTKKCQDLDEYQILKKQLFQEKIKEVQVLARDVNTNINTKPISKKIPRKRNKSIHVKSNFEPQTEGFITFRHNTQKQKSFLIQSNAIRNSPLFKINLFLIVP